MLGIHPLLERKLRKTGTRTVAEVLEATPGHFYQSTGNQLAEPPATTENNVGA